MENDNKTCGSAYEIAGYFVQNNGFVRNSSGEYIGQLSDLEEGEAVKKGNMENVEIARLAFRHTGRSGVSFWNTEFEGNMIAQIAKALDAKDSEIASLTGQVAKLKERMRAQNNHLKKLLEDHIETNAFITKRFDENYEAYKKLKKQLSEQKYSSDPSKATISIAEHLAELKAKDDLLEKMRVASENLCEWVWDLRNVSNLSPEIIPNVWGRIANCYSSSLRCREALALLSKSLPKPLNKEVKEKGSEE